MKEKKKDKNWFDKLRPAEGHYPPKSKPKGKMWTPLAAEMVVVIK